MTVLAAVNGLQLAIVVALFLLVTLPATPQQERRQAVGV
jgi:hypothetical protein